MTILVTVLICKEKSDLSARPSTIEMRGELSVTVYGRDKATVSATGIDVLRALKGVNLENV